MESTGGDSSGDGVQLTAQQAMSVLDEARSHKDNAARILDEIQQEQQLMLAGAWQGTSAGSYNTTSVNHNAMVTDIIRTLEGLISMGEDSVTSLGNVDGGDASLAL